MLVCQTPKEMISQNKIDTVIKAFSRYFSKKITDLRKSGDHLVWGFFADADSKIILNIVSEKKKYSIEYFIGADKFEKSDYPNKDYYWDRYSTVFYLKEAIDPIEIDRIQDYAHSMLFKPNTPVLKFEIEFNRTYTYPYYAVFGNLLV